MKPFSRVLPVAIVVATISCAVPDHATGPASGEIGPSFVISDAGHSPAGRSGFYFLPPQGAAPGTSGAFDATLSPRVQVVCLSAVGPTCPVLFASTASGASAVKLDIVGENYTINWKTPDDMTLGAGTYRQEVWLDPDGSAGPLPEIRLGYADLHVVGRTQDLSSVDESQYFGVVRGKPLLVKFRIETSATAVVTVSSPSPTGLPLGISRVFTATVLDLHGNPRVGATVDWTVTPPSLASAAPTQGITDATGTTTSVLTAVSAGAAVVTATSGGVSGSASLQVIDLNAVVGVSTRVIPRADACGNSIGRRCESLVGNVVTDAMRQTYGVDFAITNSGGFRANLTCPVTDVPSDFCPAFTPPPYPITRGQAGAVMPFGNVVVTLTLNGAELKTMLENGVSLVPTIDGRFPQMSGLCVTYDPSLIVGSRVVSAVRQAANGSCTGAPVDLTAAATYTLAENDFMASGGDGYPNFVSRMTSRVVMDQVVADWITSHSPISPAIQGRVLCASLSFACPTVSP